MKSPGNLKLSLVLNSKIYPLQIPCPLSDDENWKPFPIFKGITGSLWRISCHISALAKGSSPHAPHTHEEEELLLLLCGTVNLRLPDTQSLVKNQSMNLKKGQFVYYPAYFAHTLQTISEAPANYLMFKWKTGLKNKDSELTFGCFDFFNNSEDLKVNHGFFSKIVLEGSTFYLRKLHCHTSILMPGSGYKSHSDIYDVAIIVLEGEVETLDKRARPYDVIFYAAGEPHGMYNPGKSIARYIVLEFHADGITLISKVSNLSIYILHKLTDLNFWKRKLKKFFSTHE